MRTVLQLTSDTMGRGSDDLGAALMANALRKVWASSEKPAAIVFYNSGVKLLADTSPAIDAVEGLGAAGVDLVACGTCVTHFGISDRLTAGRVSDMQEIVGLLLGADRTVSL
jgi:intracellular sulfur oxidation DsrE/DsrF family protein